MESYSAAETLMTKVPPTCVCLAIPYSHGFQRPASDGMGIVTGMTAINKPRPFLRLLMSKARLEPYISSETSAWGISSRALHKLPDLDLILLYVDNL